MMNISKKMLVSWVGLSVLAFATESMAADRNPASIDAVQKLIAAAVPTYTVGQQAQGGVIIYLDSTNQHGLAISLNNNSSAVAFSALVSGSSDYVDVTGQSNGIGGGALNTAAIQGALAGYQASQGISGGATGYAGWFATLTRTYENGSPCPTDDATVPTQTCLGDWYLPSVNELQVVANNNGTNNYALINNAIGAAGGTLLSTSTTYWSSTTDRQASGDEAFAVTNISTGLAASQSFAETNAVRAVRRF